MPKDDVIDKTQDARRQDILAYMLFADDSYLSEAAKKELRTFLGPKEVEKLSARRVKLSKEE